MTFFLLNSFLFAQDSSLFKVSEWNVIADNFKVDNLGNYYLLNKNEISKYNSDQKFIGRYSNKQLGSEFNLDVLNPLKVLLFSQQLSTIIFLDNMMGKATTEINLNESNLGTVTLTCSSYNNAFWTYNPVNFSIIRFDEVLRKTVEVNFINQIIRADIHPNFICEYNNQLYINDPETGILVFDIYGTYFKTLPFKGLTSFEINETHLFYSLNDKLISYNLKTLHTAEIKINNTVKGWHVNQGKIYFLSNAGISIYKPR
jgi:hypothetical protein